MLRNPNGGVRNLGFLSTACAGLREQTETMTVEEIWLNPRIVPRLGTELIYREHLHDTCRGGTWSPAPPPRHPGPRGPGPRGSSYLLEKLPCSWVMSGTDSAKPTGEQRSSCLERILGSTFQTEPDPQFTPRAPAHHAHQGHCAPKWVSRMSMVVFTLKCMCATMISDGF